MSRQQVLFKRISAGGSLPVLDPLSFSTGAAPTLELYLNSKLGLGAIGDGAAVATWPDQSGHGRDANIVVPSVGTMTRSGAKTSVNGGPTVLFTGTNSPNGTNYQGTLPVGGIPTTNGYSVIAYGRIRDTINGGFASIVWQDSTGGKPQCGINMGPAAFQMGWRDAGGVHGLGANLFQANSSLYGVFAWTFAPPNNGTGVGTCYLNVTPFGTQVVEGVVGQTAWSFNPADTGYVLGANQVGNIATQMELCSLVFVSQSLTIAQIEALRRFWVIQFG